MRKIFIALGCYFTLSTFSGFSASQMSGHRLTEELRMLSRKSGKIISFSQTLTDQCYTDNKAEFSVRQARDFEKNLSDLLDGTFFEYKKVNDRMFLVYKIREVVTEPDEPVFVIPAIRQDYAVGSVTVVPVLMPQTSCPIDEIYFAPSVYDDMGLPKSRDRFALKTNLLYYAIPSVNLAFEFAIS